MSDPQYSHGIENEATIGGAVRRRGIGIGRPLALLAALFAVGIVLYVAFSTPPEKVATNQSEPETFAPVRVPESPGFNTPRPPPPIPTVVVPEAPPPPPPPPPVEQVELPPVLEQPVDCSNGNNPDDPKCIELARQQKLLERVKANATVYDQSHDQQGTDMAQASIQPGGDGQGMAGLNGEDFSGQGGPGGAGRDGTGGDANRAFLAAMGNQDVALSRAAKNNRTDAWIAQGTMISGTLETAINSDLAGMAKATVRDDVYSFDGRRILIPAGSSLIGDYKADIQQGQERVFIVWTRMIRGDGVSVQLGSFGTDRLGRSGMTGKVDRKYWERFGPPALLTMIGGAAQYVATLGNPDRNNDITIVNPDGTVTRIPQSSTETPEQQARGIAAQTIAAGIQQMAAEAFGNTRDIRPTIHIDQGSDINVFVTRDLDFSDLYKDPVVEEFERLKRSRRAGR
ncbi:type IV secretion system protein VirB10 [Mesorhizobium denitrificans]|uniref:TrbI/VirB10 family protein n=1 Tax=Mesorhizobium denitrificans TaxID=2294114 RepID=A0A371X6E2_9HYPH|nr:type IV secretion system protein VirB10 [Mesorhizobium denitrificans]RFC64790.1 TrbI/VirB10 family protein [Mesorhizobium denitrificans]